MNELKFISPFKRLCVTIGNLPTAYMESMSYYECITYLVKFLTNEVIPVVNNNSEVVKELQEYVAHYFDNLDVQEEINNKLDEMAESGQLADIIAQYLSLAGVLGFDTITDLKNAENITNGSICRTLGYSSINDTKGAFYKIRTLTSSDVVDEDKIVALNNFDTLIAEKINEYYEESIKLKNYYINDANVYILEVKNIEDIEVLASGGNKTNPENNIKNVREYYDNNTEYDIIINGGVFNQSNNKPIGYCMFDGTYYDSGQYGTDIEVIGFNADNDIVTDHIENITGEQSIRDLGIVNCVTAFQPLIKNGTDQEYSIDVGKGIDLLLGQLEDKSYIIGVTYSRTPLNKIIDYSDIITMIRDKYPTIETLCVLDGGGSCQVANKDMSFIPFTDNNNYLGRRVPTLIGFKIRRDVI